MSDYRINLSDIPLGDKCQNSEFALQRSAAAELAPEGQSMKAPIVVDLYCGLGGWSEGFIANGYTCIGFDITRHQYGDQKYPGQLVIQDVLTLHGSQFKDAAVIVASPPCQNYSYLAMPWSRSTNPENSKAAKALRLKWETEGPDNRLFDACFRIQREAIEATKELCHTCEGEGKICQMIDSVTRSRNLKDCPGCNGTGKTAGRYIPLIVENVRGAIPWVGRSAWNYGSFHLWGDVPALMPISGRLLKGKTNFHFHEKTGLPSPSWHGGDHEPSVVRALAMQAEGTKNNGGSWFNIGSPNQKVTNQNPVHELAAGQKVPAYSDPRRNGGKGVHLTSPHENAEGLKVGGDWFRDPVCHSKHGSRSQARKAASAQIAKIPLPLADHIARTYKPRVEAVA